MKRNEKFVIGGSFESVDANNNLCVIDIPLYKTEGQPEPLAPNCLDDYSVWAEEKENGEITLVVYKGYKPVNRIRWNDYKKYQCSNMPKNKDYFASLFSNYDENGAFVPFQLEHVANWIDEL